ncbi:hypothetical protein KPH14_011525 [Odynerus spinipes]|uniref:Uncharacterized protein n=1 Tax=Odynerus spinipes TaxID=1348599 RepID=A0AAD9VP02_9HYME|nr:hypothetical protein KPH14_011525 [Odynerus spinipes]
MDYFEDDIFELSYKNTDDEAFTSKCNPIEEHLMKQLNAIQSRIDKTKNEIEETEQTVKQISNTLLSKAVTGQDTSPDSNSDLYTIEGEPVIKNKCIDGVVLQNASLQ